MPTCTTSPLTDRTYSCSSVKRRSCGICDTRHAPGVEDGAKSTGAAPGVSRNARARAAVAPRALAPERRPHRVDAPRELGEAAGVVDDDVGTRALQLGGHLRRDYVHRVG